jgi:hypothetical protein
MSVVPYWLSWRCTMLHVPWIMYECGAILVELKVYNVTYAMNNYIIVVRRSDFDGGGSYIHVRDLTQKYVIKNMLIWMTVGQAVPLWHVAVSSACSNTCINYPEMVKQLRFDCMWNEYAALIFVMLWCSQVAAEQTWWLHGCYAVISQRGRYRCPCSQRVCSWMSNLLVSQFHSSPCTCVSRC